MTRRLSYAGERPRPAASEENRVRFACENGERIEIRFSSERDLATLIRQGKRIELEERVAGSGFIYGNGPTTVRGKGSGIMVEIGRMAPFRREAL